MRERVGSVYDVMCETVGSVYDVVYERESPLCLT